MLFYYKFYIFGWAQELQLRSISDHQMKGIPERFFRFSPEENTLIQKLIAAKRSHRSSSQSPTPIFHSRTHNIHILLKSQQLPTIVEKQMPDQKHQPITQTSLQSQSGSEWRTKEEGLQTMSELRKRYSSQLQGWRDTVRLHNTFYRPNPVKQSTPQAHPQVNPQTHSKTTQSKPFIKRGTKQPFFRRYHHSSNNSSLELTPDIISLPNGKATKQDKRQWKNEERSEWFRMSGWGEMEFESEAISIS